MNKRTKAWLKQIRKNAKKPRILCETYYPGRWDEHTPGKLVAVGEVERRGTLSEKKICQTCRHFDLKMICGIVQKKKNPLLSGCHFWKKRTSPLDIFKKGVK